MNEMKKENSGNHLSEEIVKSNVGAQISDSLINEAELGKAVSMITVEIIEYVENAVVIKTILKKSSGNVSVMSVDTGEGLAERTTPFDTFVQVIDGKVELIISSEPHLLKTGASIIIPAQAAYYVKPDGRFKMILTIIKSAYE
jgi:quercetin dioxygenase-like cupin family protein